MQNAGLILVLLVKITLLKALRHLGVKLGRMSGKTTGMFFDPIMVLTTGCGVNGVPCLPTMPAVLAKAVVGTVTPGPTRKAFYP